MRRWWHKHSDLAIALGLFALAVALIGLAAYFEAARKSDQQSCRDGGGRVEEYNHRTIMITSSCGSGCFYTVPVTVSDWRCVKP